MPRPRKQHLKQQADGRFYCKYRGVMFSGTTEDEALEKREQFKRSKTIRTKKTFGEYVAWWLPIHKAGVKATTYNCYATCLTSAITPIADVILSDLTTDDMAVAYAAMAGKSAGYIQKVRVLMTEILDSAVDAGYLASNPVRARSLKPPKGISGTHRVITDQEREAIHATPHRMQLAALIMLYCGLRKGEVLALEASDFTEDTVTVSKALSYPDNDPVVSSTKTAHGVRRVPVPGFIVAMLPKSGIIVPGNDKPYMTHTAFNKAWRSYQRALGSNVRPHDLRHSYCTMLRDAGIDMHQAIIWMGHADEKLVLRIYDHPGQKREDQARRALNRSLSFTKRFTAPQPPSAE